MSNLQFYKKMIQSRVEIFILQTLSERDKYGIEILNEINNKGKGVFVLKIPTLYALLKRLQDDLGLVTSYQGSQSHGAKRRYYQLTDLGRTALENNRKEWEFSRTILDMYISDETFDLDNDIPPIPAYALKPSSRRTKINYDNVTDYSAAEDVELEEDDVINDEIDISEENKSDNTDINNSRTFDQISHNEDSESIEENKSDELDIAKDKLADYFRQQMEAITLLISNNFDEKLSEMRTDVMNRLDDISSQIPEQSKEVYTKEVVREYVSCEDNQTENTIIDNAEAYSNTDTEIDQTQDNTIEETESIQSESDNIFEEDVAASDIEETVDEDADNDNESVIQLHNIVENVLDSFNPNTLSYTDQTENDLDVSDRYSYVNSPNEVKILENENTEINSDISDFVISATRSVQHSLNADAEYNNVSTENDDAIEVSNDSFASSYSEHFATDLDEIEPVSDNSVTSVDIENEENNAELQDTEQNSTADALPDYYIKPIKPETNIDNNQSEDKENDAITAQSKALTDLTNKLENLTESYVRLTNILISEKDKPTTNSNASFASPSVVIGYNHVSEDVQNASDANNTEDIKVEQKVEEPKAQKTDNLTINANTLTSEKISDEDLYVLNEKLTDESIKNVAKNDYTDPVVFDFVNYNKNNTSNITEDYTEQKENGVGGMSVEDAFAKHYPDSVNKTQYNYKNAPYSNSYDRSTTPGLMFGEDYSAFNNTSSANKLYNNDNYNSSVNNRAAQYRQIIQDIFNQEDVIKPNVGISLNDTRAVKSATSFEMLQNKLNSVGIELKQYSKTAATDDFYSLTYIHKYKLQFHSALLTMLIMFAELFCLFYFADSKLQPNRLLYYILGGVSLIGPIITLCKIIFTGNKSVKDYDNTKRAFISALLIIPEIIMILFLALSLTDVIKFNDFTGMVIPFIIPSVVILNTFVYIGFYSLLYKSNKYFVKKKKS